MRSLPRLKNPARFYCAGFFRISPDLGHALTGVPGGRAVAAPDLQVAEAGADGPPAGDLTVHGFRIDLPSPGVGEAEIAALFTAWLR